MNLQNAKLWYEWNLKQAKLNEGTAEREKFIQSANKHAKDYNDHKPFYKTKLKGVE